MAAPGTTYSRRRLGAAASTADANECVSFGFAVSALDGSRNGLAVWPLVLAAGNIPEKERHNHRRDILMLLNTNACRFCSRTMPVPHLNLHRLWRGTLTF